MNKRLSLTLASAALLAAFSQAQIVTVNLGGHTGTNANSSMLVSYLNGPATGVTATPFNAIVGGVSFIAYCVELGQGAAVNTSYPAYRESIRTYLPSPTGDRLAYLYNHNHTPLLSLDDQAALQVAIWEARYDSTFDLDNGNFKTIAINGAIKTKAQAYLANLASPTGPIGEGMYYQSDSHQDIMGPVPEPASLMALGVGAVALLRRRKNAKK